MADIDHLRALYAKATPGEWRLDGKLVWPTPTEQHRRTPPVAVCDNTHGMGNAGIEDAANAAWIAESHEAFPALADEVEALRAMSAQYVGDMTAAQRDIWRVYPTEDDPGETWRAAFADADQGRIAAEEEMDAMRAELEAARQLRAQVAEMDCDHRVTSHFKAATTHNPNDCRKCVALAAYDRATGGAK